jgi:hypothetical protein
MSIYVTFSSIADPVAARRKPSRWSEMRPVVRLFSRPWESGVIWPTMDNPASPRGHQVRQILASRGLSLYRVSERSAEIFGRSSLFYVPHSLYSDGGDPSLIPTFHQVLALSHISDYRLSDWLAAFGFDLDLIPRLRLLVPRKRTTLLDSRIYDSHAWIPWFADRGGIVPPPAIAPLGQLLARVEPVRAMDLLARGEKRFLYGKVGEEDVYAFPHLAPGSIVRIDPNRSEEMSPTMGPPSERRLFFVEHDFGYSCSQLVMLARDRVVLHSPEFPCTQIELILGRDARILGRIDAEIRPVAAHGRSRAAARPVVPPERHSPGSPHLKIDLKDLLQSSRLRAGLSFREASSMSRWIANLLADDSYFAATSTLSDYETLAAPPRHIQKVITLCVLYSIDFHEFLGASGLPLDREGREPMPDKLVPREVPGRGSRPGSAVEHESFAGPGGFLDVLIRRWEEIPLFLRHALGELTTLKQVSLSDIFWVGGDEAPIHPWLDRASLVAINRRIKRPAQWKTLFDQPLYLVLKRDGGYLCGCCALDEDELVVHLYPGMPLGALRFRNGIDAEVIGQVTTILRRLV